MRLNYTIAKESPNNASPCPIPTIVKQTKIDRSHHGILGISKATWPYTKPQVGGT